MKPGPFVCIARVVLKNTSALSICTGQSSGVYDSDLITDWNGLPCIPATALVGVLRSLWRRSNSSKEEESLFGFQEKDEGAASRLSASFGLLRSYKGEVFESIDLKDGIKSCKKLTRAQSLKQFPDYRHGVAINTRGVAADTGKFDVAILPRGFEFSIEFRISGNDASIETEMKQLLGLMKRTDFRLGRRTRSGYGAMEVTAVALKCFDLKAARAASCAALNQSIADHRGLDSHSLPSASSALVSHQLTLTCGSGGIRIGGGHETIGKEDADLVAYTETDADGKRWVVIPGSSIRGALRHRTLYYLYCLNKVFADSDAAARERVQKQLDEALGYANSNDENDPGQAGHFWFSDVYLAECQIIAKARTRNSIDRFTGGVRNGMLFTEENIYPKAPITIEIAHESTIDPAVKQAFELALTDLKTSRLALGANGSNGVGLLCEERSPSAIPEGASV